MSSKRFNVRSKPIDPYQPLPVYHSFDQFQAEVEASNASLEEESQQDDNDNQVMERVASTASSSTTTTTQQQQKKKNDKKKQDTDKKRKRPPSPPPIAVPGTLTEQLAIDEGKARKEVKINLPVPESKKASTFDQAVPGSFEPDNAYIRHRMEHIDDYDFTGDVEYELTLEDELWLEKHPKYGPTGKIPLSQDMLERFIDLFERKTAREIPIPLAQATDLIYRHGGVHHLEVAQKDKDKMVEDVYNWWMQKRKRMLKPLLRRFWPVTAADDSSPNLTFRPREKERYRLRKKRQNDVDSYEKMVQLKNDFEMLKCLLELVKRREQLREMEALLLTDEFEENLFNIVKQPNAATPPRVGLAPTEIDVGPLDQSVVDSTFESVVVLPGLDTAGTQSPSAYRDVKIIDGAEKRKKKRDYDAISVSSTATGDVSIYKKDSKRKTERQRAAASGGGATASGSGTGGQGFVAPPPKIAKVHYPQFFLRPLDNVTDYMDPHASEVQHPNVPTWPPPNAALQDYRRKFHQRQQQQQQRKPGEFLYPPSFEQQQEKALRRQFGPPIIDENSDENEVYGRVVPAFRSRGRIGRGGRYIIDRIPVFPSSGQGHHNQLMMMNMMSNTKQHYESMQHGTPYYPDVTEIKTGRNIYESGHDFIDPAKQRPPSTLDVQPLKLTVPQRTKIENAYIDDDSEEEDIEFITYPYLPPLRFSGEDATQNELIKQSNNAVKTVRETKFRLIV